MVNKLNPKIVSLSLVVVSVILLWLCALSIVLAPKSSLIFLGSIFHGMDITKIATSITLSGVLLGTVAIVVIALITGWLFAVIYNYFINRIK
ncbi:hypothetical protein J4444_00085 [Candidatus Woesearchaeota archaeon]|nr:hypothetical protein [Candidatus Woesearchaeota archaeon]